MSRRLPNFLRPAEVAAFLGAARTERDRIILLCGLYLGLRVSEIVRLRVEDIDLDADQTAFVREGKGDKDRVVPIPDSLIGPLRDWIGGRRTGWLFPSKRKQGDHLGVRAVQHLVKRLKEAADIVRRCTPHTMRHTYATELLSRGANLREVQTMLGHASISTTERYTHVLTGQLKRAANLLPPIPSLDPGPPPP